MNRLQTVGLRFCGEADQALPRLRGALPSGLLILIFINFRCIHVIMQVIYQQKSEKQNKKIKSFEGINVYSKMLILLQITRRERRLMNCRISIAT